MSSGSDPTGNEALLWRRAGVSVLVSMIVFTLVGAALMTVALPGTSFVNRAVLGVFIGFWSGPFFGTALATGYHFRPARLQRASVTPLPVERPAIPRAQAA